MTTLSFVHFHTPAATPFCVYIDVKVDVFMCSLVRRTCETDGCRSTDVRLYCVFSRQLHWLVSGHFLVVLLTAVP
jgi:hypothetical protein